MYYSNVAEIASFLTNDFRGGKVTVSAGETYIAFSRPFDPGDEIIVTVTYQALNSNPEVKNVTYAGFSIVTNASGSAHTLHYHAFKKIGV